MRATAKAVVTGTDSTDFLTYFHQLMSRISCLSAPADSTLESSPVNIRPVKPLPAVKKLNFLPPRCILLSLVHPGGNI